MKPEGNRSSRLVIIFCTECYDSMLHLVAISPVRNRQGKREKIQIEVANREGIYWIIAIVWILHVSQWPVC
jgi:hypothetical protein